MSSGPISTPPQVVYFYWVYVAVPLNLIYRKIIYFMGHEYLLGGRKERPMGPAVGMEFGAALLTLVPAP